MGNETQQVVWQRFWVKISRVLYYWDGTLIFCFITIDDTKVFIKKPELIFKVAIINFRIIADGIYRRFL